MRRDDLYLAELIDAAREIARYLYGVTQERWERDSMLRSAVLHQLMIIGEVARALSEDVRTRHPEIPWAQLRGFRNIAVHEYFALDTALVWRIACNEVPKLEHQGIAVLRDEFPDIAEHYERNQ